MNVRSGIRLAPLPHTQDTEPSILGRVFARLAFSGPPDLVEARQASQLAGNLAGDDVVIAVLDSGCRASHTAFSMASGDSQSRVLPGRNFADGANPDDISDAIGHGTAVSGLAIARLIAPIVAPKARILPLKVFSSDGSSDFSFILDAFTWLLGDGANLGVSVVCLSTGDTGNWPSFEAVPHDGGEVRQKSAEKIRMLRDRGIPTIVAAGNSYCVNGITAGPGMCFPAIMPECISVGAIFTSSLASRIFSQYGDAEIEASNPGQLTPFSQRLPQTPGNPHFTRLFAPGASLRSTGILSDTSQTDPLFGTSAAAPCVAGVVALLQAWYKQQHNGKLPLCDDLERWLLDGADNVTDNAGNLDNVENTGATFKSVNALGAMRAMMASSPMS